MTGNGTRLHIYIENDRTCRRQALLAGMTGSHFDDDHACGFCDSKSCYPTCEFETEKARPAADSAQARDLLAGAMEAVAAGDFPMLMLIIQEAKRQGYIGALAHHATAYLQYHTDSLAGNYLAAEALRQSPSETQRRLANRYFRKYAGIANVGEMLDSRHARRGYVAYHDYDPAEAIRAYAVIGSATDNASCLVLLATNASGTALDETEQFGIQVAALAAYKHQQSRQLDESLAALRGLFG